METLVRNTTLRFSRRAADGYEPLNQAGDDKGRNIDGIYGSQRAFSRPRSQRHHVQMMNSFSYRRDRARKRQIFLQTYKLTSMEPPRKSRTRKLKRVVVKVKSAVVSILSFIRADTLRSCNNKAAISASSPTRIMSCC